MNKQISPVMAAVVIGIIVLVAIGVIWTGTQKHDRLPDKPPSGPITLPPSQQGRSIPGGTFSGAMPGASAPGK